MNSKELQQVLYILFCCTNDNSQGVPEDTEERKKMLFKSSVKKLADSVVVEGGRVVPDTLQLHIDNCKLDLEKFGQVHRDGNCWYDTIFNLCLHHHLDLPAKIRSSQDLRLWIVDGIERHPCFSGYEGIAWLRDFWGNDRTKFDLFKKHHNTNGSYTDNLGIIVFATQHLLQVNLRLAATSCNAQHPVVEYEYAGPGEPLATFFVGYYQDESHKGGKGGHYHSLREVRSPIIEEVMMK